LYQSNANWKLSKGSFVNSFGAVPFRRFDYYKRASSPGVRLRNPKIYYCKFTFITPFPFFSKV